MENKYSSCFIKELLIEGQLGKGDMENKSSYQQPLVNLFGMFLELTKQLTISVCVGDENCPDQDTAGFIYDDSSPF